MIGRVAHRRRVADDRRMPLAHRRRWSGDRAAAADRDARRRRGRLARGPRLFHADERGPRSDPEPTEGRRRYDRLWDLRRAGDGRSSAVRPSRRSRRWPTTTPTGTARSSASATRASATAAIRRGARLAQSCGPRRRTPLTLGVAHDAERLGAVGEVAVGPDEYAAIRLACRGRLLTTTNVGTRVNVRHFLTPRRWRSARHGRGGSTVPSNT